MPYKPTIALSAGAIAALEKRYGSDWKQERMPATARILTPEAAPAQRVREMTDAQRVEEYHRLRAEKLMSQGEEDARVILDLYKSPEEYRTAQKLRELSNVVSGTPDYDTAATVRANTRAEAALRAPRTDEESLTIAGWNRSRGEAPMPLAGSATPAAPYNTRWFFSENDTPAARAERQSRARARDVATEARNRANAEAAGNVPAVPPETLFDNFLQTQLYMGEEGLGPLTRGVAPVWAGAKRRILGGR